MSSFKLGVAGLFLLAPMLFGGKCNCKPDDSETVDTTPPPPPEPEVQVARIDPASGDEGVPFDAKVYGSAFKSGAKVSLSGQDVAANYVSENAIEIQVPSLAPGSYDITVTNPDGKDATLPQGLRIRKRKIVVANDRIPNLLDIYSV